MKKTIIFDFDGTIADTLETIVKIYNNIAPDYNCKLIKREDDKRLRAQRPQDVLDFCGVSSWRLPFLLLRIRKELKNHIRNVKLVDGIKESILEIKRLGYELGILTSNSKDNVNIFFEINGLESIFDFVHSEKSYFRKERMLKKILKSRKIHENEVVYIGDETRDIEASRKARIEVIAVSWGFNSKEILKGFGPDYLIDKPEELPGLLRDILTPQ
jgi:phosphoglycolate phosphatase-like HAD superfamily hydrolase